MDALRWILLVIAALIIVAIYFFSRTRSSKERTGSPLEAANDVPSFSATEAAGKPSKNEWVDGVGPVRVLAQEETSQNAKNINGDNTSGAVVPDWDSLYADTDRENFSEQGLDETKLGQPAEDKAEPIDNTVNKTSAPDFQAKDLETSTPVEPQSTPPDKSVDETKKTSQDESAGQAGLAHEDAGHEDAAVDDVISVYVLASEEEPYIKGEKILSASYALQLEHGEMNIFHRHNEQPPHEILFSMANVLNPGWFEFEKMNELQTRGMSFFMQVNLVDNPSRVLDDMLICAHQMATMLGAVLCNPQRQPLDEAYTNILREKVKHLEKLKVQSH